MLIGVSFVIRYSVCHWIQLFCEIWGVEWSNPLLCKLFACRQQRRLSQKIPTIFSVCSEKWQRTSGLVVKMSANRFTFSSHVTADLSFNFKGVCSACYLLSFCDWPRSLLFLGSSPYTVRCQVLLSWYLMVVSICCFRAFVLGRSVVLCVLCHMVSNLLRSWISRLVDVLVAWYWWF